jgi:hypothetical protein
MFTGSIDLRALQADWQSHWQPALRAWSPYIQLTEPTWCHSSLDEQREGLTGSFAMIRLVDQRVVISLRQVAVKHLQEFATEILAHEIGHHVYCPADLTDHARALTRLRAGLPTKEHLAPFIGNLYEDLLINDRLQRSVQLHMAEVYKRLNITTDDPLWLFYMRIYELLWQLDRGFLAMADINARINTDAQLGARLIRSYAKDWLDGAGRFAALCLPYLLKDEAKAAQRCHGLWNDTTDAGKGGVPDGLTEIEADELDPIHPADDPDISGIPPEEPFPDSEATVRGYKRISPPKHNVARKAMKQYRDPFEYAQVLRAAGCDIPEALVTARYYRERALPHLIRFPVREIPQATDPTPEGLETWDIGSPLQNIDWIGTLLASPVVIPGLTTRERLYGSAPGNAPESTPVDLYLGVDCSGSMGNPATAMSYPVLAGAIIALSALRAGAKVMVALSGEPGKTVTTDGFIRDENQILKTLTDYLGTGTTFGIHRLGETFSGPQSSRRPAHILIITDNDIFPMLDQTPEGKTGWEVAREAAANAGGGATYVLQLPQYLMNQSAARQVIPPGEKRMIRDGWNVAHVNSMEEMILFAKHFSQTSYGKKPARKPHAQ